ncbi:hypothetical protein HK098_000990 [Nowakowskiella sp. JEL0407]|nr:hypothetical protein HK098_000990 [Nowakowskiella sp. JEL0407]
MIAIWLVSVWSTQNLIARSCRLVELGPGRGTLTDDILRLLNQVEIVQQTIRSVHLVEASPHLRKLQAEKIIPNIHDELKNNPKILEGVSTSAILKTKGDIPVYWHDSIDQVPTGLPILLYANEFFDAMAIHKFKLTENGWREIMVDLEERSDDFRYVLSPKPTTGSAHLIPPSNSSDEILTIPYSTIPSITSTLSQVKRSAFTNDPLEEYRKRIWSFEVGDTIEISPDTFTVSQKIAEKIEVDGGAALVIDYGDDEIGTDTLRAIKKQVVSGEIFEEPGTSDLSSDVDFGLIRFGCAGKAVTLSGPITQQSFLKQLGIVQRKEVLKQSTLENPTLTETEKFQLIENLESGCARLIDTSPTRTSVSESSNAIAPGFGGMGSLYKVATITRTQDPVPFGFGENEYLTKEEINERKRLAAEKRMERDRIWKEKRKQYREQLKEAKLASLQAAFGTEKKDAQMKPEESETFDYFESQLKKHNENKE